MQRRPVALDGNGGEPRDQPLTNAAAARPLSDIKVLEKEPRAAEPGGKIRVEQRKPGGLAVDEREQRLEPPLRPEAVPTQIILGRDYRFGRPFVAGELTDQLQQQTAVVDCSEAKRNRTLQF